MNKRVLLTGATGFIGRHCLTTLSAKGYNVHAVSSKKLADDNSNVHWHKVDLLDTNQVSDLISKVKPTHLLHLAWYAVPVKYWTAIDNFRWVSASIKLIELFAEHGGVRLVAAGSCAEYNWHYGYCSERVTPLSPSTPYGICKHSLQLLIEAFAIQAGISAAWGRVFHLYGPHEYPTRLVASVIISLLENRPALCSHGNQLRSFLHVQDTADAFIALLESNAIGPVNIASDRPVSLKDVIFQIAEKLDRRDLVRMNALAAPSNDPPLLVADVKRLTEEVKWLPKIDLQLGLEATIDWWRESLYQ